MRASFAESSYASTCDTFKGGSINVSFGHGVLDLCSIKSVDDHAVLAADVSFGCGEIYLPVTLRADTQISTSAGDVDVHGAPNADAKPIKLTGNVSFGSIELYYR